MIKVLAISLLVFQNTCKPKDSVVTYGLNKDSTAIVAYYDGKIKWEANVLSFCGEPFVGEKKIRYYRAEGKIIDVVYGKHDFASIDINTGRITCLGAD